MQEKYDHKEIEKKWQKDWADKNIYKTSEKLEGEKAYVLDMFPYPSGDGLHVGHPKGYIATDVYSRMKKMQGFNVLHPMGWDAFGLPAENYAIKNKIHPRIAVEKNIKRFKEQLEKIGFNYDWQREINTTDPEFYKWTQWIFLKLLEKGLAYESHEPINWCPSCQTGLANEDLENGACERCGSMVEKKPMRQWVLKITDYAERLLSGLEKLNWPESIKESQRNWIGKSEGTILKFEIQISNIKSKEEIEVFTTRADTLFGVTYLVVAPEHPIIEKLKKTGEAGIENWKEIEKYIKETKNKTEIERTDVKKGKTGVEIKGVKAINPANGEEVPIFVADYVLGNYGTGAVMAVPAHDDRDFEFTKKYDLPIKQVIMPDNLDIKNPPRKGKKDTDRNVVHVILRNTDKKEVLVEFLKGEKWEGSEPRNFIIGGIEDGESEIEAAIREIKEETGYTNVKFVEKVQIEIQARFFAAHKDVNRVVHVHTLVFDLVGPERVKITEDEYFHKDSHELKWISYDKIVETVNIPDDVMSWEYFTSGGFAFIGEGVIIHSDKFDGMKSEEAREKITEKFGEKVVKYKLRDWVFSRQRYWGEPIPVVHCEKCGVIPVPEKDLPIRLPEVEHYEPTGTGESPLANITEWINTTCPKCGGPAKRETNTMPQWAGSSWYYLRYIDPKNNSELVDKKKEKYFSPIDMYVGGAEHATRHLIYARFWHKFLYDIGIVNYEEPFARLQNVGLILAQDGKKMSKRFGNVINPDDMVEIWGADSLRLYEMFMGPFSDSITWNTDNIIGVRRFLERVWKIKSKIVEVKKIPRASLIEGPFHKTIKKVGEDIESYKFNTAISTMMILLNEMEKLDSVDQEYYEIYLRLLAPFAPHITEELWHKIGRDTSIHLEEWPKYNPEKIVNEKVNIVVQINGKIRAQFETESGVSEDEAKEKALSLPDTQKWLVDKEVKKVIFVPNKIVNFVV